MRGTPYHGLRRYVLRLTLLLPLIPYPFSFIFIPDVSVYAEPPARAERSEAGGRPAKVAGTFYPDNPEALRDVITQLLNQHPAVDLTTPKPRMLILPHAGYIYSGIVASRGFRELQGRLYDGVVVVGFTHRDSFEGSSVDDREAYLTPLGAIAVDTEAVAWLKTQPRLHHLERVHESDEHSLEVMLPFLQVALGSFKVVPLLMGSAQRADAEALAEALAELAKRGDYLFVFSTDLSHYHPYQQAVRRDEATINALVFETGQAVDRLFTMDYLEACGRGPLVTSLLLAQRLGYPERRLLAYANSGDTTGDTSRVVGYCAIGLYERSTAPSDDRLSPEAGMALVSAARQAIAHHLADAKGKSRVEMVGFPELMRPRGVFVTLRRSGKLRGCIGRIETETPLVELLPTVALESALHDSRFEPLATSELEVVTVEVSVLTPPHPIRNIREIVAGRDGVVLRKGPRTGVFLPQVWSETGWTRLEFLRELASQKAGLEPDAWQQAQLLTFQDQVFEEERPSSEGSPH